MTKKSNILDEISDFLPDKHTNGMDHPDHESAKDILDVIFQRIHENTGISLELDLDNDIQWEEFNKNWIARQNFKSINQRG